MPPAGFSRIGVRKDEPLLLSLLNKAIASITEKERDRILAKWYGTNIPPLPSYLKKQEKLELSPEEQAWLAQDHTVRVRVVDFPPFIKIKEGQKPTGISIDYLNLIADRTGIKFKYILSGRPFAEDLKRMQNLKGPDLVTSMMRTPDREKMLLFSNDYISMPRVIFTRTDGQFISHMDDLIGRTIAVPKGTVIQKQIQQRYPQIKLLLFNTDLKSLEAIATDQVDAYVGNLTLATYLIEQRGLSNLKVAAPSPFGDHVFSYGVRKDWPELRSIINKGLDSITPEEKAAIRSKHLKLKYEYGIKPGDVFKWTLIVAGSVFLILLLFLFWNRSLAKKVQARTSKLTNSQKLLEAEIEERKLANINLRDAYTEIENLKNQLEAETAYLQEEIRLENDFEGFIGQTPAIQYALYKIEQVAATDTSVLVFGETGTGKELICRAIHNNSLRKARLLVKVDCAVLPATLIESELFGHERGAFTGAQARRTGRFEVADGSAIFLDEIGELPLELQGKLLRVLQDGEFERLGSSLTIKVDVRVIAATNRNLEAQVREGRFREDLYYRLNVFPITVPPLRERSEDIPLLTRFFVEKAGKRLGRTINFIPENVMRRLQEYPWPGNVRELQNVIERAVINSAEDKLRLADDLRRADSKRDGEPIKSLQEIERNHIIQALEETNWRIAGPKGAAVILKLNPNTLRSRIRKLGIKKP
jgi:DNA-binding NtrC family response regulator/ABC-type amino acid transport substrate-binding protein